MRIFVSVDLEGINGVVNWDQCSPGSKPYDDARVLMAAEANAAIAGAFDAGATEVLVNDAHGTQRNLPIAELDRRTRLVTGHGKPLSMMQGIDESFDAAFLVGYHAGAGTPGVLSHTYDGTLWAVKLNSRLVGEVTLNAAVAGYFGVPVALVTGDSPGCREALSNLGTIETVAVKDPITRYSAVCGHPTAAGERIKSAARAALDRMQELEPFTLEPPVRIELVFNHTGFADAAELMPGARRVEATSVAYTSDDFIEVYRGFLTMLRLAGTTG